MGRYRDTPCLNCTAPLVGDYCARCGQRALDLAAPTLHAVRDAVSEAVDIDGRVVRTLRALASPGRLTLEFLRGRRAPYVGPLKLAIVAGAALSSTWVLTRGIDSSFYGYESGRSAAEYIERIVRGSLAASIVIAVVSWALTRGRRRVLDEAVFALHLVAALSIVTTLVIWLGTLWKVAWVSAARVPAVIPALVWMLFVPAMALCFAYIVVAVWRVHGGSWWAIALRSLILTAVGVAAVTFVVLGRLY